MKSINNNTEYDDILYWNVIIESFKKMFAAPVDSNTVMTDESGFFVFLNQKKREVHNVAKGIISRLDDDKNIIEIEHENNIKTIYKLDKINNALKTEIKLNQGDIIGYAKRLEMKVVIPLNLIFEVNK